MQTNVSAVVVVLDDSSPEETARLEASVTRYITDTNVDNIADLFCGDAGFTCGSATSRCTRS